MATISRPTFVTCCGIICATLLHGSAQSRVLHIIKAFCGPDGSGCTEGSSPSGGLIRDSAGNLYGATSYGGNPGCPGNQGCGTIFELAPDGALTVLYAFGGGADGGNPVGRLTRDRDGNLYGAAGGGTNNSGVVFEIAPDGAETVLHAFGSGDGSLPAGSLLFDKKSNIYGVTQGGNGGVFKLAAGGKESVLYTFCQKANCQDGQTPNEGLVIDAAGNLYGTTQNGGTGGIVAAGTVFEVTPDGKESVLWNFCSRESCSDGEFPMAGLIRDAAGNLYGTTDYGGVVGSVFELAPDGSESVLHAFDADKDGYNPLTPVTMDKHGTLYGTTSAGGSGGAGTAFEIAPDGSFKKLLNFPTVIGGASGLLLDKRGTLYGTSPTFFTINSYGDGGTVFAIAH